MAKSSLYHHYDEVAKVAGANVLRVIGGGVGCETQARFGPPDCKRPIYTHALYQFMQGDYSGAIRFTTGLVVTRANLAIGLKTRPEAGKLYERRCRGIKRTIWGFGGHRPPLENWPPASGAL
ncbi:MAG: hypothetical protein U0V70_21830 [Terriglobia bacterium]